MGQTYGGGTFGRRWEEIFESNDEGEFDTDNDVEHMETLDRCHAHIGVSAVYAETVTRP